MLKIRVGTVYLRPFTHLIPAFCAALLPAAAAAATENCPSLLSRVNRLALVTVSNMNSSSARLRLYERVPGRATWLPLGAPEPTVLGASGAAWAPAFRHLGMPSEPVKREGDYRTPTGIFTLGRPFGFAPLLLPNYLQITPDTICVDDPQSPAYNSITTRNQIDHRISAEHMHRGPLYRLGVVVDYPTDAARRAGSCIFIHVWKSPRSGTAGCIGLPDTRVTAIQKFAGQPPVALAVLPEIAIKRLGNCLPSQ